MKQIGRRCNKLYKRLGLDRDCSKTDIHSAYIKKARIFHPDVGGDKDKFVKILEAYQILSDPFKKRRYDHAGVFEHSNISEETRIEQLANSVILNYFNSVCRENKNDILFIDIMRLLKENISNDIFKSEKELKNVGGGIKVIKELLKRIKYSGNGVNVMEGLMLNFLQENEAAIINFKDQIKERKAALKLLKNYQFRTKSREREEPTIAIFNLGKTGTSTSGW